MSRCHRPGRCSSFTAVPVHLEPVRCRHGSPPPAASPRSCRPPRYARRRRRRPCPPRQCGLRPSHASALRTPSASTPLPDLPAPCVAPPSPAPSELSALHASTRPAPAPSMTTPIVDAPTSSVCQSSTPCRAPTSRQPLGSPPPASSPRSRPPPRCARPRRRLRVRVARCGLHRHRPLHFAILYCPFQCQHLCQSLRQRASHDSDRVRTRRLKFHQRRRASLV